MSIITSTKTSDRITALWSAIREACRIVNAVTYHAFGALLKLAVVVYFVFCILILALRYVVLPNIDAYKPDIERLASQAIGNTVTIAAIDASWEGWRPRLSLHDVLIRDKFGNHSLKLPEVSATLAWWRTALAGDLRLYRLEIDRPDMDVRRDADGKLYVAGIYFDTGKSGNGQGADWVLSQREIVIRDGRLRWNDYLRAAPELVLENVDFALRNRWRTHSFSLTATPPAAFSAPLDIRAVFNHPTFTSRISDASRWKGELYADLHDTDLTAWKSYFDYPIDIQRGKGSVRAWLNFDHAKVADFTSDLNLSNVSARLRRDLPLMSLADVSGRVSVREEIKPNSEDGTPTFGMNGHAIQLTDFSLRTDDGLVLPKTSISESFRPARFGRPETTEVTAKLIDLQTLASFVERLPLPAAQRQILADFEPRGLLNDLSVQWQGSYPDVSAYSIKGQFAGLSLKAQPARPARARSGKIPAQAALPAIPGFDNLTGWVDASDRGGRFGLTSDKLTLQLPAYFSDPAMPLDRLLMQASWTFQEKDKLVLDVQKMDFAQEGLSGSITGRHVMPLDGPPGKSAGTIDVTGKFDGLELQKVGKYLPTKYFQPPLR